MAGFTGAIQSVIPTDSLSAVRETVGQNICASRLNPKVSGKGRGLAHFQGSAIMNNYGSVAQSQGAKVFKPHKRAL